MGEDTCRFVKEQDGRVLQQDPRYRQALLFPSADHQTSLPDWRLVPLWQPRDRLVHIGLACGFDHLFLRGVQSSIADVVHDIRMEERRVLRDNANVLPLAGELDVGNVLIVDGDGAR